jgi:hypothetical protein
VTLLEIAQWFDERARAAHEGAHETHREEAAAVGAVAITAGRDDPGQVALLVDGLGLDAEEADALAVMAARSTLATLGAARGGEQQLGILEGNLLKMLIVGYAAGKGELP